MEMSQKPKARRAWVSPVLRVQSTLTNVTQVKSPLPLTLLFFAGTPTPNTQCFDARGNSADCTK